MKTKTIVTKSDLRFPGYVPAEEIQVGQRLFYVGSSRSVTPVNVVLTDEPWDGNEYRWAVYLVRSASRTGLSIWDTREHAQEWAEHLKSVSSDVIFED